VTIDQDCLGNDISPGFLTTYGINQCADVCNANPQCGGFGFSTNPAVFQNYCFQKSAVVSGGSAITGFFCYAKVVSTIQSSNQAVVIGAAVGGTIGGVALVTTVVLAVLYTHGPAPTRERLKKAFSRKPKTPK
jgi:hypothetical protein